MLVVCNGAIKSGSTWLYNILDALLDVGRPAEDYLTGSSHVNATIRPDKMQEFLEREDYHSRDFLTKNHLGKPEHKELLLSHGDVVVVDIVRDIRDVVVSAYYDAKNRNEFADSFDSFYWTAGRELADAVTKYHQLWTPDGERVFQVSYESLQSDFSTEVERLAAFFGVELPPKRAASLREQTSMDNLRKRYDGEALYRDDKFFRKGVVGDWRNHFSPKMLRDIERIERNGLNRLDPRTLMSRVYARFGSR